MKTTIYYLTGTGNSLWVARTLAAALSDTDIVPMTSRDKSGQSTRPETVGLVFPVHMWGLPGRVLRFIPELRALHPGYVFAVAVNAGQVSNTLVQLNNILRKNSLSLAAGFEIKMPSNYIPWGGPGSQDSWEPLFKSARQKIDRIAGYIKAGERGLVEKGPLWQRVVLTAIYNMSLPRVPKMDKQFWADEKCDGCGICAKICLSANIIIRGDKPTWHQRCEQCLACIQWCPQRAIQYGKKTPQYERYHHPEITLKDMLAGNAKKG